MFNFEVTLAKRTRLVKGIASSFMKTYQYRPMGERLQAHTQHTLTEPVSRSNPLRIPKPRWTLPSVWIATVQNKSLHTQIKDL